MKPGISIQMLLAVVAVLASSAALAQNDDFDSVEIIPHHVRGNVYYLEGRGGNIGVSLGENGVVLVDDQFAPLTDKIVAAVESISDADIRFVINTHVHGDHVGGNENLAARGVSVIAHDNVRLRLTQASSPIAARPVLTFPDSAMIQLDDEVIEIIKVPPAHTDGDSYVFFRNSDVLHLGDVFRTTGYGFIDTNNGGSAAGTIAALQLAIDLAGPDTIILPGHGMLSNADDVREFMDVIIEVEQRVSALIEQEMTLEQVLAAQPTADLDERWGDPERFLTGLYNSIAGM
ncbi:MBL fold metallo-hydrolase [Candidatus Rariloculus sp.]|uniref:MBL fold metallo-hydrolase n=1 Tax=Candidatus Rariloculus sp. TaxID=3101265 RepID=UPI003D0B6395